MNTHAVTRATMIAALYTALTIALAPVSYGPLQFRVSEALTVLP
ncbi:MAG TPA: QueT transporter family protein, partial [Negativicutes bacterium]